MRVREVVSALILAAAAASPAWATVQPNVLFSDHVVLQRGMGVPVWGTASDGEKVTVTFNGQTARTTAQAGKWMVKLKPMEAGGPYDLTVVGENKVTVTDVLVGDVWVCSGQSNMERQLGPRPPQPEIENWKAAAAAADYPQLRHFGVAHNSSDTPLTEVKGKWVVCTPQTAPDFTAVGFFFGRDLQKQIKVPIGLLHTSVGGTPIESWTRPAAFAQDPATRYVTERYETAEREYPDKLKAFKDQEPALLGKWQAAAEEAKKNGKPAPRKPTPPAAPKPPGGLYNAMVAPLIPFAIKGVIWYQGESNGGNPTQYRSLFPLMIQDWRKQWSEGEGGNFPFLYVQVAPYGSMPPAIREAQFLTLQKAPNTAMVVLTDVGDAGNVHPPKKAPVGARLALAARALAYGEKIEYSGPLFQSMAVDGNKIVLKFTHTGAGLEAKGGSLKGFTIAGANKKFVPADAAIVGDTAVVTSPQVPEPKAVRYGWANVPDVNLFNKDGLPASPFRTDVE